jgi:hypothetical protein
MVARRRNIFLLLVILILLLVTSVAATSAKEEGAMTVAGVEYLGEVIVPTGVLFGGTEIGGLSSITYDSGRQVYYVMSDDQGNRPTGDPVRYYTVAIDMGDGSFDDGDLEFVDVRQIFEDKTTPFAPGGLDPEGLVLSLESLNLMPNGQYLVTAGEGALFQDGPASTDTDGSLARILVYDLPHREPSAEYVYDVGPWAEPSAIFGVNGIVEVLPIDDVGTMLVMERSFSVGGVLGNGTGNYVVIKEISTQGATDVLSIDALYENGSPISFTPVFQQQIFAFDDLGVPIDNIEGMTFGPPLPDGRQTLVIVSDNNFSPTQFTQFIVLALDIEPVE